MTTRTATHRRRNRGHASNHRLGGGHAGDDSYDHPARIIFSTDRETPQGRRDARSSCDGKITRRRPGGGHAPATAHRDRTTTPTTGSSQYNNNVSDRKRGSCRCDYRPRWGWVA